MPSAEEGARANGPDTVRDYLATTHQRHAVEPLRSPSEEGVFPSSAWTRPHPVVADAMWLRDDIRFACIHRRRTVLVNVANEQLIRVFCAQHVIDEIVEHSLEWTNDAKRPVPHDDFMRRLREEYLPVIHVVPDDGIPASWLSPDEARRLDALTDRDDVPSVKLSLALHALYVSKDKRALRAAYGDAADFVEHEKWLHHLKAGGDAGELTRMLNATGGIVRLAGYGVTSGARRVYSVAGPLGAVAAGAAGYALWQWFRHPSRSGFAAGVGKVLELFAEMTALQREQEQRFQAALPPAPTWRDLSASTAADAVVGRACLHALAREPIGHLSAEELAEKLETPVAHNHNVVRSALRSAGCFAEVYRGRWQAGAAQSLALDNINS